MTKEDYINYAQIGLGLAMMLVFSRVFLEDNATLEVATNILWAQSLACYARARSRHMAWGALGFFFGIFGFISLFFLEDRSVVTE